MVKKDCLPDFSRGNKRPDTRSRMTDLGSAKGMIRLLDESGPEIMFALTRLNDLVEVFWPEIAESLPRIRQLTENPLDQGGKLACLVVSKLHYHLGEYTTSMEFALKSGDLFNIHENSEYVSRIKIQVVSEYVLARAERRTISTELERVMEQLFGESFGHQQFQCIIDLAIQTERIDICSQCFGECKDALELAEYVRCQILPTMGSTEFRTTLVDLLVTIYKQNNDFVNACHCLVYTQDHGKCGTILKELVAKSQNEWHLVAFQIGFDLYMYGTNMFLECVVNEIKHDPNTGTLVKIISGEKPRELELEFLYRNNRSDKTILNMTKSVLNSKNSLQHSALTFSHAIMQCGTTNDDFLRHNMDFLSCATNWSKFSAIAGFGLVHKGQVESGLDLLSAYLPQNGPTSSPYSEGGALFGLGLIHMSSGPGLVPYFLKQLKNTQEVVQHGTCLGLGLVALGSGQSDVRENLRNVLFSDSAVAGEAAGLAMGLTMVGSGNTLAIDEMLQYAHETEHEKIVRGLSMGIGLIMYGRGEDADTVIEQLLLDRNPILRYGGVYCISLAYAGSGNTRMLEKVLHIAVSDSSDDVKRAAVASVGFLLLRQPEAIPKLVSLLAESFNPHVRYGVAQALGIGCAGTGLEEAVQLLEPLTGDIVDFVRQGAFVGLSLILIQHNGSKAGWTRKLFERVVADKHEDHLARFGAILAQGILDAGGRNVTVTTLSGEGSHLNRNAIVGLALFSQFWNWYSMIHFIGLAFRPTCFIGLTKDMNIPKMEIVSRAKPSLFSYPLPTKTGSASKPDKTLTAVLSMSKKTTKTPQSMVVEPVSEPVPEEPSFQVLGNLSRILPQQLAYIEIGEDSRYVPVVRHRKSGFVMLRDTRPDLKPEYISEDI